MSDQVPSGDGNAVEVPSKIDIPQRLFNDLQLLIAYGLKSDEEAGGLLIEGLHGGLGVVAEQLGEGREIVLEPNEDLHQGERYFGTVHVHPVTGTASTGDMDGYLRDENELVMLVMGSDKSINIYMKTPVTALNPTEEPIIKENFEQEDIKEVCEAFGILFYRSSGEGEGTVLDLMNDKLHTYELDKADETWPAEHLVEALGLEGLPEMPKNWQTKKWPKKGAKAEDE